LVKEILDSNGNTEKIFPIEEPIQVINEDAALAVRNMYRLAVKEGTAWRADQSGVACGGKTGTSQNQGVWFTGFAPFDDPRWVVTVYLEEGVAGGTEGAEVFAKIVKSLVNFSG
jgi:penicillin-binding protein 2